MTTASSKKYKLRAGSDANKAICAFFSSAKGCRNGSGCNFLHVKQEETDNDGLGCVTSSPGSVVSSETEDGEIPQDDFPFLSRPPQKNQHTAASKNKSSSSAANKKRPAEKEPDPTPTVVPSTVNVAKPASSNKSKATEHPQHQHPPNKKQKASSDQTQPPKRKNSVASAGVTDFRSLNLPVASFSIPTSSNKNKYGDVKTTTPTPTRSAEEQEAESSSCDEPAGETPTPEEKKVYPLPQLSVVGPKWLQAVQKTQSHNRFNRSFEFPDKDDSWIKARPYGSWCAKSPQIVAIDCEMCETQDPVSELRDHAALCRVSIVDALEGTVLLDTLVKPNWPVKDYRTRIHGISPEDLKGVEFTLRHAQAFLMALCSSETIIVGQSLHNDLSALKMEHYVVVDSAYLFQAKDSERAIVGLADLSSSLLKKDMPKTHDSVLDARTALACVQHYLDCDGKVEPIARNPANQKSGSRHAYATQLLVHRIPKNMTTEQISTMFMKFTFVAPIKMEAIDKGKTIAHFLTARHANLAFGTLPGKAEPDPSTRLQKKVHLQNGSYIRVRMMSFPPKSDEVTAAGSNNASEQAED